MPDEHMGVGAKCQDNSGECQGNVTEKVQSTRAMQGNAGGCQGNVMEWVQSPMGM